MRWAVLGTRGIPASYGGFETAVEQTAPLLVEMGHQVRVYGRCHVRAEHPPAWHGVELVWLSVPLRNQFETLWHVARSILHLATHRVDLVHVYNLGAAPLLPLLWLLRIPVITSVDGIEWKRRKFGPIGRTWMRLSEGFATHFADRIIADNPVVADYWREKHPKAVLRMIPYGGEVLEDARSSDLALPDDLEVGKYLLFIGRFVREKNIELLLSAYRKSALTWPLVLVGGNPYDQAYVDLLHREASPDVRFVPPTYGPPLVALLRGCGIFVQPSELEGTSPVILQAMGAGCAVVANGIDENVYTLGDAGILFPVNDADALSEVLRSLAGDPERRKAMGSAARERVRLQFPWRGIAEQLDVLGREVVGMPPGPYARKGE